MKRTLKYNTIVLNRKKSPHQLDKTTMDIQQTIQATCILM